MMLAVTEKAALEALVLSFLLLILIIVLGVAVLLYRRHYFAHKTDASQDFSLADIRRMYKEGQVSEEEYERMRQRLLAKSVGHEARRDDRRARIDEKPSD